jgi:hypothetical protein
MRRVSLSLVAAALLVSVFALPVVARVDGGCGNGQGWDLMPADADALIAAYPPLQRAMDDGVYDYATLVEQIDARNKNGNDWLCVKDPYGHSTSKSGGANAQSQGFYYFVNAVDDNAAPK